MSDSTYQSHFQNYVQHVDSASAMQLAYYQSTQVDDQSQSHNQHKFPCVEATRIPSRSDSLLYTSEFADPNSNLELAEEELNMPYSAYSSSAGYPMVSPEGPLSMSNSLYYPYETVATSSSHITPEPMYAPSSPAMAARHQQLHLLSDPCSLSWPSSSAFQVSPHLANARTPSLLCSPYTVKSQQPITSHDVSGGDTPTSPLSLARSKRSSISPSPGPLTPAISHISLQTELCTVRPESRPTSSGSSRSLYTRVSDLNSLLLFSY
jgi:hypothetical protein